MAQTQGSIAARNMMADQPNYAVTNIPFFWTAQYGKSLRYCGHALYYDKVIMDYSPSSSSTTASTSSVPQNTKFVAYYIFKERVLACCSYNRDPVAAQVVEVLNAGITLTGAEIQKAIANQGSADAFIKSKLREAGHQ